MLDQETMEYAGADLEQFEFDSELEDGLEYGLAEDPEGIDEEATFEEADELLEGELDEYAADEAGGFDELSEAEWEQGDDVSLLPGEGFEATDAEFLGKLFKRVGRWVKKGVRWIGKRLGPLFKKLAPIAARIVGGVVGGPAGAAIGNSLAGAILREAEGESMLEAEEAVASTDVDLESVGGSELEYAAMEAHADAYATARTAPEAASALAGMIRNATRMFARNPRLRPIIPRVSRAAYALARTFRANPRTRFAIRLIPQIVARTLGTLARMPRVTPQVVVQVMARHTARVLASPGRARAGLRSRARRRRMTARRRARRCRACGAR